MSIKWRKLLWLNSCVAPQKRNGLQTVMRQESMVQIHLLNELCEVIVPLVTKQTTLLT